MAEFNRAKVVDQNFPAFVERWPSQHVAAAPIDDLSIPLRDGFSLTGDLLLDFFDSMLISRHMDLMSRALRAQDKSYYTIGSVGHEGNVVLGQLVRYTDPAFLHYRSGALFVQRSKQVEDINIIRDVMLSFVASKEDPIAGGRHKVWGSRSLWVPPQTSTIASHLPKAVGAALGIDRAARFGASARATTRDSLEIPEDSIVLCSFGDASLNHSVALSGFNFAGWLHYQKIPVPILFVCEDNGIGISVNTPPDWVQNRFKSHPDIKYFYANGLDLFEIFEVALQAASYCRQHRAPTFLHLKTVRLLGHAGSDMELEYRALKEVEETEAQDPLLQTANLILQHGLMSADEMVSEYEAIREAVRKEADYATGRPKLTTSEEIIQPLAPYHAEAVHRESIRVISDNDRRAAFHDIQQLPEQSPPRHLAVMINYVLRDLMVKYPETLLFGEDVAKKGGVYYVTAKLHEFFGADRVFNTLLDETSILGLANGLAHLGFLPIPEIQYLAYFHNACDQIRGEASSLQFFSQEQFRNPMVVRIASLAYQKGFGGHFHNDNSIAALRDIPGVVIAAPARGDDAVEMLRTCFALAKVDGRVVLFLEPIALYMTRDLYEPKDNGWLCSYPPLNQTVLLGEGRIYHPEAQDLTMISFCNGLYLSLRAAKQLREKHNIHARVIDLRWLNPLNGALICQQARIGGRVLVVDETRCTGGMSEAIFSALIDGGCQDIPMRRVTAVDSFIPLGPAALKVLPSEDDILQAALSLCS